MASPESGGTNGHKLQLVTDIPMASSDAGADTNGMLTQHTCPLPYTFYCIILFPSHSTL